MKHIMIALIVLGIMIALVGTSPWARAVQAEPGSVDPGLALGKELPDSREPGLTGPRDGADVATDGVLSLPDDEHPIIPPIIMTYTVGLDPAICARTKQITVEPGTPVVYCFQMTNNTSVELTRHDLVDSHLGIIFEDLAYTLRPQASWVITDVFTPPPTAGNTATWTAYDDIAQQQYQATDTATVIVVPDGFRAYLPLIRKQ
jgi:hypothetical protein